MSIILQRSGSADLKCTIKTPTNQVISISELRLHLNAPATSASTFTVTYLSSGSTASPYSGVIFSQAMSSVQDVFWQPTRPIEIGAGDKILCAWVNDASSYKTWGLEVRS